MVINPLGERLSSNTFLKYIMKFNPEFLFKTTRSEIYSLVKQFTDMNSYNYMDNADE